MASENSVSFMIGSYTKLFKEVEPEKCNSYSDFKRMSDVVADTIRRKEQMLAGLKVGKI
jgi:hypothetical protein